MAYKRFLIVVCALGLILPLSMGAKKKKNKKTDTNPTSESVSYAEYGEQLGRVRVIVGSYAASFEEADEHFALQVAVGVNKDGQELEIDAKAFVLLDPQGNAYAMSLPQQVNEEEELVGFTDRLNKEQPLVKDRFFANLTRVESNFYGIGGQLIWSKTHLNYDTYFEDVIFFPKPKSGFDGVFVLHFFTPGIDGPIQIKFKIPPSTKKKDK